MWDLDAAGFGSFVDEVPAPLCIGRVLLVDGTDVAGFLCEPSPPTGAGTSRVRGLAGVSSALARLTSTSSLQAGAMSVMLAGGPRAVAHRSGW